MSRRRRLFFLGLALYGGAFVLASALGGMAYFHFGDPKATCASCHEMTGVHTGWNASAHRTVHCRNCHGGSLTLDAHALRSHMNRVVQHLTPWNDLTNRTYDANTVLVTDSAGTVRTTIDALGRLVSVKDKLQHETTYTFGPFGPPREGAGWASPY